MRKQYCMEWDTKSGRNGWKSLGHDLTEKELTSLLNRKMKQKSTASAFITWNYTGDGIPEEEFGKDHFFMGLHKKRLEVLGMVVYIDNEIEKMKGEKDEVL